MLDPHTASSTSAKATAARRYGGAGRLALMDLPDFAPALAMWTTGSSTKAGDMNLEGFTQPMEAKHD